MTPSQIKVFEKVTGKFLYIACALDDTMLHAVNEHTTSKSDGTQKNLLTLLISSAIVLVTLALLNSIAPAT